MLMSIVPTPSILHVWFLVLRDAQVLLEPLPELFVTSLVFAPVHVLADVATQTVHGPPHGASAKVGRAL